MISKMAKRKIIQINIFHEKKRIIQFSLFIVPRKRRNAKNIEVGKGLLLLKRGKTDIETENEKHIQSCRFQNCKYFEKTQQRK